MDDKDHLTSLQFQINQLLYEQIMLCFEKLKDHDDGAGLAIGIMISAISTNLGVILAQIPDRSRDQFIEISKIIVEKSLQSALESISSTYQTHGQVGHA